MKPLKEYIEEDLCATPANTMGMGNPSECSGDMFCVAKTNKTLKRKKKKYKKK